MVRFDRTALIEDSIHNESNSPFNPINFPSNLLKGSAVMSFWPLPLKLEFVVREKLSNLQLKNAASESHRMCPVPSFSDLCPIFKEKGVGGCCRCSGWARLLLQLEDHRKTPGTLACRERGTLDGRASTVSRRIVECRYHEHEVQDTRPRNQSISVIFSIPQVGCANFYNNYFWTQSRVIGEKHLDVARFRP